MLSFTSGLNVEDVSTVSAMLLWSALLCGRAVVAKMKSRVESRGKCQTLTDDALVLFSLDDEFSGFPHGRAWNDLQ
jgi:hypothetical protein